ncbi:hypothetical protein LSAT2_018955 [Lamellibrachia satsuma]|nr:hypothetical protein LSAT2_018955 [Lamellibrachia satsuma]
MTFGRWRTFKPKKRCRYSLLREVDNASEDGVGRIGLLPTEPDQYGSLRMSDVTTDEETLFVNRNTKAHIPRNGFSRNGRNKVKT